MVLVSLTLASVPNSRSLCTIAPSYWISFCLFRVVCIVAIISFRITLKLKNPKAAIFKFLRGRGTELQPLDRSCAATLRRTKDRRINTWLQETPHSRIIQSFSIMKSLSIVSGALFLAVLGAAGPLRRDGVGRL
jgi:hypothetical protein